MKLPRQLVYAAVLLLMLAVVGAALLAGRRFYQGLIRPRGVKLEMGSTAWSLPEGSVGSFEGAPAESSLPREQAGNLLHNPQPSIPESVERGREIYRTYCLMCHGAQGHGDGPMAAKLSIRPPDLTVSTAQRSDGYLYATIRNGGVVMPSQGSRIDPRDRWHVVNYVRSIQTGPTTAAEKPTTLLTRSGGASQAASPTPPGSAATLASGRKVGAVARGRQIFETHCATCHDPDSNEEIIGPGLKNLFQWPAHNLSDGTEHRKHTVEIIRKQITQGGGEMSAIGASFSGQQIADLIAYLTTL